ncbi:MAG TPA: hypothetical protein VN849_03415 [Stellaceae bacterium]|nr:hypothetical protein [Stellaceae bacterium]
MKRPEADHVVVISQIGLNIDPEQFSLIDMDDLDPVGAQGAEQLILDPRLHNLADIGRAAAEVEQRRQPPWREKIHHGAEPAGLGFEHRGLARKRATKRRNPGVASPPDQSLKTARCRASGDLLGKFPDTPSFPAFGACRFPARSVPEWPVQVP